MFITAGGGANSSQKTTTNNDTATQQFQQVMDTTKSASGTGSPESAKSGADAAKDLLSSNNPYFYNPLLHKTDPSYDPEQAKAEAFAATLHDYEKKGDNADIGGLLNTLGPAQAAQLFAGAGNLQGLQVTGDGTVFAKNQADLDQVLGKALFSPGVQLGEGTQPETLASGLLQQATQSGNNASSIAGILNQSGRSTQVEALRQEFLEVNPWDGIFGSNGARVPAAERGWLKNELSQAIDANLFGHGQSDKGPATGFIGPSTQYDIQQYLAGKLGNGNESPSQRLANMMSVLGPTRAYAVLASLTPAQAQQLGIQQSLNTLTENGQFTASDTKKLAIAQANFAASYGWNGIESFGSLMNSLPNDQNGTAVKIGYAQGCISAAQQLAQEIGSGKYSGQNLEVDLNALCENVTNLNAGFSDPVKEQLFHQLNQPAAQLAATGSASAKQQGDILNAYAANILGTLRDKSEIASVLRAMGGVGPDEFVNPQSGLAKFLQSALRGQSDFGIASFTSSMIPNGEMPKGVTALLNGISGSGDTKLVAGTLDTVMQWTIKDPRLAEVLAGQDTGNDATGYRNALTSLLDKSFNQFVALDPIDRQTTHVTGMQPQMIADLQALSTVEMAPPSNKNIARNFAQVLGKHAAQFAAYAEGHPVPQLDNILAAGPGDNKQWEAANIFGQLLGSLHVGLNPSLVYPGQQPTTPSSPDAGTVAAAFLNAFGAGLTAAGIVPGLEPLAAVGGVATGAGALLSLVQSLQQQNPQAQNGGQNGNQSAANTLWTLYQDFESTTNEGVNQAFNTGYGQAASSTIPLPGLPHFFGAYQPGDLGPSMS